MKLRKHFHQREADQVLEPLRLKMADVPKEVPHLHNTGLRLPKQLTSKELRQIAAAARLWNKGGFALGDLLLWLRDHPDPAITFETFVEMLQRTGITRRTLYNYQSVSSSFPIADRQPGLSRPHHDAVRKLPREERQALLREAAVNQWTPVRLKEQARIRRQELVTFSSNGANGSLLRSQAGLVLERCQKRISRIVRLLSDVGLTGQEAASLENEPDLLSAEIDEARKLIRRLLADSQAGPQRR